jgi:hypothetical protein
LNRAALRIGKRPVTCDRTNLKLASSNENWVRQSIIGEARRISIANFSISSRINAPIRPQTDFELKQADRHRTAAPSPATRHLKGLHDPGALKPGSFENRRCLICRQRAILAVTVVPPDSIYVFWQDRFCLPAIRINYTLVSLPAPRGDHLLL